MVIFLFSNTLNCSPPWNPLFFLPGTLLLKRVIWMIPSCYPGLHSNVISLKRLFPDQPGLYSTAQEVTIYTVVYAMVLELGMYSLVQFCTSILNHSVKLLPTILEHKILLLSDKMLFVHLLYRMCTCILPLLSHEDRILPYYSLLYSQNFEQNLEHGLALHIYLCNEQICRQI